MKSTRRKCKFTALCEEVVLGSLGREHIAEYLNAAFAPNDFPPELASLIHDKTEGNLKVELELNSLAQQPSFKNRLASKRNVEAVEDHGQTRGQAEYG